MKLYRIVVSYDLMVAAENEDDAACVGVDKAEQALRDMTDQPDMSVSEVERSADIPREWRDCYPYRDDDTTPMTCAEIVAALEQPK